MLNNALTSLLHRLPAETAHDVALKGLTHGWVPNYLLQLPKQEPIVCNGLEFKHPIGLAAGFDKNADAVANLVKLGFSFIEVGTVTPKPQPGNPKPRLFRLSDDKAIINRLGFNGKGHDYVAKRLEKLPGSFPTGERQLARIGVNLGKNKISEDAVADYVLGVKRFETLADYLTINISSPNTPGLRDWQTGDALQRLLQGVLDARQQATTPIYVKIAPDLDEAQLAHCCETMVKLGVDGIIVSNTTIARPGTLQDEQQTEIGGLSGKPLFASSTNMLKTVRNIVGPELTLIGVGGVMTGDDARAKLAAGANLIQTYTGFIYGGLTFPLELAKACSS